MKDTSQPYHQIGTNPQTLLQKIATLSIPPASYEQPPAVSTYQLLITHTLYETSPAFVAASAAHYYHTTPDSGPDEASTRVA